MSNQSPSSDGLVFDKLDVWLIIFIAVLQLLFWFTYLVIAIWMHKTSAVPGGIVMFLMNVGVAALMVGGRK